MNLAGSHSSFRHITTQLSPALMQVRHFGAAVRRPVKRDVASDVLRELNIKSLAEELNREYPDILHTPIEANPRKAAIDAGESREITEEAEIAAEVGQVAQSPDYAFSA